MNEEKNAVIAADDAWRHIVIERAGVVGINIGYDDAVLTVNSEDMLRCVFSAIMDARTTHDDSGNFAARVRISIELLGDRQEAEK